MKKYITNCVNCRSVNELHTMIEKAVKISFDSFIKDIDADELQSLFPDYNWKKGESNGLKLMDDWAVSYWKSKFRKKPCVFINHSSIEYIFC